MFVGLHQRLRPGGCLGADNLHHHRKWQSRSEAPGSSKIHDVTDVDIVDGVYFYGTHRYRKLYTTTRIGMCDIGTLVVAWSPPL